MEITFDPDKAQTNIAERGLSLAEAALLDWATLRIKQDVRQNYGEDGFIGYGEIAGRLYCVVFTPRDDGVRIISFRKANMREVKRYEQS